MPERSHSQDLEAVYREQYRPLVGFLLLRVRDRARAEELAQEAFVRALQARPDNPRAWLFTVGANLARDDARRNAVRARHLHVVRHDESGIDEPSLAERREEAELARTALATLNDRDREVLLLKERGSSYDEIAAALDLSVTSVGTTLARARRRLTEAWARIQETGVER